jgi:nitronate monooxygenase
VNARLPGDVLRCPVVVAPMAGGPSTPALVVAAAHGGAMGFLATGYKTAAAMRTEMDVVRAATRDPFGVNVFVPGAPTGDPGALAAYIESLAPDATALGTALGAAEWEADDWATKIEALLDDPPAVVSFTFGCPEAELVAALQAAGSQVWITVTQAREAARAAASGADALCVQGTEAGAHRGIFSDSAPPDSEPDLLSLVAELHRLTDLPLLAAGGIVDRAGVLAALGAGAVGVQCGTVFLRCPESGTNAVHRAALADRRFEETAVTRAFSGRPARGLLNRFMLDHPDAPAAYPEINNATRPLRAAAVAAGDAERLSLWAGTGHRSATDQPLAMIINQLCGR